MSTVKIIYTFVFLLSQKLLKWNLTQAFLTSLLYLLTQLPCYLQDLQSSLFSQVGLESSFAVAQSLSRVRLSAWPMDCSMPGLPVSHCLLEFVQVYVCWISDAIQSSLPLSLLCLSFFPSIRVFSSESALHIRWPEYWSFSFSINPSNAYSRLISFRIYWLDLLALQGTLESSAAPQFKSINSSVLSLLYSPTLTSVHGYWKKHSFDYTEFCW